MGEKKFKSNPVIVLQPGTARNLIATWPALNLSSAQKKFFDGYSITWVYNLEGVFGTFKQSQTSSTESTTWTAPEHARNVYIHVKAKTKKNGKKSPTWHSNTAIGGPFDGLLDKDPKLVTPGTPTVSASGGIVKVVVTNYNDERVGRLCIELYKDGSLITTQYPTIAAGKATIQYGGVIGSTYTARAQAQGAYSSEWSSYSAECTIDRSGSGGSVDPNLPATPPAPTTVINDGIFEARVDNYTDPRAQYIHIQIVENDSTIVANKNNIVVSQGTAKLTYNVVVGRNYKARACARRTSSPVLTTDWSSYSSNIKLATEKPPAPTADLDIEGTTLIAKVNSYSNENVDYFEFQVARDNLSGLYKSGTAKLINGQARLNFPNIIIGSEYRVRARAHGFKSVNKGLFSDWGNYSQAKKTIPENVSKIETIAAMSSTSIKISWKAAKAAESYRIQYTFNHEGYVIDDDFFDTGVDVTDVEVKSLFYPALNLEMGKTYYFRLKAKNSAGESLKWTPIVSCVIGTTPDPPTTWSYTTVGIIGDPIVLNWAHSTQDSADQTGAKVYIKIIALDGTVKRASSVYVTFEDKTSQYSFDTSTLTDGDTIYWQVSTRGTKGIEVEWSDLSTERSIPVYVRPTLSVTAGTLATEDIPVIQSFPIDIQLTARPTTQVPIAYYIRIIADQQYDVSGSDGIEVHVSEGEVVYQTYIEIDSSFNDPNNITLTLNPGDLYLVSDIQYTISGTVSMSNGLSAEDEIAVKTSFEEDDVYPNADISIDEDNMTAMIRPFCTDYNDIEISVGYLLAVYRADYDGSFVLIQNNIPIANGVTVFDMHPSLDYARYRIVATNITTGLISYDDVTAVKVGYEFIIIQWGGTWKSVDGTANLDPDIWEDLENSWSGTFLKLPYNVDVSDDIQPDVSMVEYIGRKHPVAYYGTQQGFTSSWKVDIKRDDKETLQKIRALSTYPGDAYVREPYGTGYWANVKVSYSISHNSSVIPVTFTIVRVEGGA